MSKNMLSQKEASKRDKKTGFVRLEQYKGRGKKHKYICPKCQQEFLVQPDAIWTNNTKSCGCAKKTGYKSLTGCEWNYVKRNAKLRKISLKITVKQAWGKFIQQYQKCALTGLSLSFNQYEHGFDTWNYGNASLDRIDSSQGYTIDNIWWIHKVLNHMKGNMSLQEFLNFCELVCYPKQHIDPHDEVFPRKYSKHFKGIGNLPRSYFTDMQYNARKRNIDVSITIDQAWAKFVYQRGYCAITGVPLSMHYKRKKNTASLDRIDSSQGYMLHNIQWVHKQINIMKKNLIEDTLLSWCKNVVVYNTIDIAPKLIFLDLDGVVFKHHGSLDNITSYPTEVLDGVKEKLQEWYLRDHQIIITTGRQENMREFTEKQLFDNGIFYDKLIMGIGRGPRTIINDKKPNSNIPTAKAINLERNKGMKGLDI